MARRPPDTPSRSLLEAERSLLPHGPVRRDSIRVALVFPNHYRLGMSNLGYQAVFRILRGSPEILCERAFLPDSGSDGGTVRSLESGLPLGRFDIVAFSVSFESDYLNVPDLLRRSGIPPRTRKRDGAHPLVMAGGVACMLNPEPIAPFVDLFLMGEAETSLGPFLDACRTLGDRSRERWLLELAPKVPGVYVPRLYEPVYAEGGILVEMVPTREDLPRRIDIPADPGGKAPPVCSAVVTPHTVFDDSFLIEVGRGCPHGCRFCGAGYIYRPPRFRPLEPVLDRLAEGASLAPRVGLVGAAVSDHPGLEEICRSAGERGVRLSFSSLRADALAEDGPRADALMDALVRSGVKTATIAPDAGSERMRRVINKGMDEDRILRAVAGLVGRGIFNLKLYFMVGLPTETDEDVGAVVRLCRRIKERFLDASRSRGRIGRITVSLNSFVPKPFTPFQWVPMAPPGELKRKIRTIRDGLRPLANVDLKAESPRHAYVQALLSRGDRRVADLLEGALRNGGNWAKTLKASPMDTDGFVLRARSLDEPLPWDHLGHGVTKAFLKAEYRRALREKPTPPCPMDAGCRICGACPK